MKKCLLLGGSLYQTYAVKEAVKLGYYAITCDYLPDNPGHKFAHEYHNVSTTDKDAVLALAWRLKVDGVVAYASDPAAPVAAYVCEKLGLPTSPYASVEILSKKDLFRKFLADNGFNVPKAKGYTSYEAALKEINDFKLPVMVKPVDSSGSKGINKLTDISQLKEFVSDALSYSREKRFLIEEFIVKKGYQISGDAFSVNGELVFHCFGNEYYSAKVAKDFAPLGECWPFLMDSSLITRLHADLQRLLTLLGMKTTAYNVEAIVDENDNIHILEVGARSGGSLIPQITKYATGVDMVPYVIKAAMGEDCSDLKMAPTKGRWANYMVHANATGVYAGIHFDSEFEKNHLVEFVTDIKNGDPVHKFRDAQDCIGELILKFDSPGQMFAMLENMDAYVKVDVRTFSMDKHLTLAEVNALFDQFDTAFEPPLFQMPNVQEYIQKLSEKASFAICKEGDKTVAFTAYYLNDSLQQLYVTLLAVAKDRQHHGIGTEMMAELEKKSAEMSYSSIGLEVDKLNTKAFHFYLKNGFRQIEDRERKRLLMKRWK